MRKPEVNAARAGLIAAVVSGVPSTLYSLAARRDPLEATVAAGSMLLPKESRRGVLVAAAVPVHLALSLGWAVVLSRVLPRERPVIEGVVVGLGIAALDLGVVGRRFPRIRALPSLPQVADHVAYGLVTAVALAGDR